MQKLFISCNNLLNQTISIPFLLQRKENSLIVGTIQSHFACVHHGTFLKALIENSCCSKHREIIIVAHNYFKNRTQTKQLFV